MAVRISAEKRAGTVVGATVSAVAAAATALAPIPAVSDGTSPSWPTASTTGTSGTLTNNSTDTLDTSGATYNSINFTATGTIQVTGDNMTFNNCKFHGELLVNEVDTCTLTDCEFVPAAGAASAFSVSSSQNVTLLRAKIENWLSDDCIHLTNDGTSFDNVNITIQDCYFFNANTTGVGAHSDGCQVRGSNGLQFIHNYVDLGGPAFEHNSAFYLENGAPGGDNTNFTVEDNYFHSGYGATLYISNGTGTFQGNTIAPAVGPLGGDSESTDFSSREPGTSYQNAPAPSSITDALGNVDENGSPYDIHNPPS